MTCARVLAGVLSAALAAPAAAGGPGTTGGVALKIPAGARPAGTGGAFVGLADDLNALFWNPAGLATLGRPEASVMHVQYLADTSYEVLAYGQSLGPLGGAAGALNVLNYGALPRTLEDVNGLYSGLSGSSSPQDIFVTGGWGRALPPLFGLERLSGGANVKMTFQHLAGGTYAGIGVTGGALWDAPVQGLRVGTVIDNLGGVTGIGRSLPLDWVAGGSYAMPLTKDFNAVFALDSRVSLDTSIQFNAGAEVEAFDLLMVRAGGRFGGALGGLTLGLGVKYPVTWGGRSMLFFFDYAHVASGELGDSQRFQLSSQFGGRKKAVYLGKLRAVRDGGDLVLTWEGAGPAWDVAMRRADEMAFTKVTDRPLTSPKYPLIGMAPGRYAFTVATVDPYLPDWRGPVSPEIEVDIEGEAPAAQPGSGPAPSPAGAAPALSPAESSATPAVTPAPAALPAPLPTAP